jgi:competence protein ComEC
MIKGISGQRLLIFFLLILFFLAGHWLAAQYPVYLYEAEAARLDKMIRLSDPAASGGAYVSMKDSGLVTWDIPVTRSGYYNICFRYRAKDGDKEQLLLKNSVSIPVGFGMTDKWKLFSQPFYLKSGLNEVGLKSGWGYMDIDWISIQAINPSPGMTPKQLTFYRFKPHNPVIKIDNYHQAFNNLLLDDHPLSFKVRDYPYQESAVWLEIPASALKNESTGTHLIHIVLDSAEVTGKVTIFDSPVPAGLIIIAPDIEHGSSVLMKLPTGKNMLIDCAKDWARDSILIPLLQRHKIDTIQTFILTHYHEDHDSGDRGKKIIDQFHVKKVIDYHTYPAGYQWQQDSISIKILNSYKNGYDENTRSLSFKIMYHDFVYVHGGDTYAYNQKKILRKFLIDIPAHVFYANHHFHGSVDPQYIRVTNPDLVLIQAQEAIYARHAFMVKYKEEAEKVINQSRDEPVESLFSLEVGTVVIRIRNAEDWWYETYRDQDSLIIPGLMPVSKENCIKKQ